MEDRIVSSRDTLISALWSRVLSPLSRKASIMFQTSTRWTVRGRDRLWSIKFVCTLEQTFLLVTRWHGSWKERKISYGCISFAQTGACRQSCKSTAWSHRSFELLQGEQNTSNECINEKHNHTYWGWFKHYRCFCVCGNILYVWGTAYLLRNLEPVKEIHEPQLTMNSEKRFLSVDSTHSFPWRAASSPPWPCLVYCLPRSSCGTSNSRACDAYFTDSSTFINATHSSLLCAKSMTYPAKWRQFNTLYY